MKIHIKLLFQHLKTKKNLKVKIRQMKIKIYKIQRNNLKVAYQMKIKTKFMKASQDSHVNFLMKKNNKKMKVLLLIVF